MSAGTVSRLRLQPRQIFFSAGYIWVLDTQQPVAALIDPSTRQLARLVDWSELPPGSRTPTTVSDDYGLWVQHGRPGPITRVGPGGIEFAEYSDDCALVGAGPFGAWCVREISRIRDIARSAETPPAWRREQRLLHVRRAGGADSVAVDGILAAVDCNESSLFVGVHHDPWGRVPRKTEQGISVPAEFEVQYTNSWLEVPLSQPVPTLVDRTEFRSNRCPPQSGESWHTSEYADQDYNEDHQRKRAVADNIRWHWGKDPLRRNVTLVKGYGAEQRMCELELPGARVVSGCIARGLLWLTVWSDSGRGGGMHVLTIHPDEGAPRRVGAVDDVDIEDHRWPRGPKPLDHDSFVEHCVRRLDGLAFSERVSDVHAEYVGGWPDGYIRLSYKHSRYPNLRLESRVNLYDNQGRRLDDVLTYVPVELMERADTGAYPPISQTVDGVLHI